MVLPNPFQGRALTDLDDGELEQGVRYHALVSALSQHSQSGYVTEAAVEHLVASYGYPEVGTSRMVFLDEAHGRVLKIAFSDVGATECGHELAGIPGIPIARAEPAAVDGVRCGIWMEWVDPIDPRTEIPAGDRDQYAWILRVDMMQVGRTRSGVIVAYDAGRAGQAHAHGQRW
ncbi:hypothetical protein [Tsukamurella hominis]|uniref:hypothetical protein n=1 Tax=Tsukamurella hominis TaxID=1970232 RepID=UPI0039E74883